MKIRDQVALTFDDVLLVPQHSAISSRNAVDTSTQLTPTIRCAIPILSANMDTVTEAAMAVEMARAGGIGIIHRFLSPERQAQEVARVKRAESYVVSDPITIEWTATLRAAVERMRELEVSGLIVVDSKNKVAGILTERDLSLVDDLSGNVADLMTPLDKLVTGRPGIPLAEARQALHRHRVEKLPLVDEEGFLKGLITAQDILKLERHPDATKDERGRLRVGAAIGVRDSDIPRAEKCLEAGADLLVLDIAHGHSDLGIEMVTKLRKAFPKAEIMAGNVATAVGVRDLARAGASSIKVGVGSGSICTTRIVTGSGYPQLSAVADCAKAARAAGVSLISDGGIRNSGDITKALAAGADAVMLGSLLAGTTESPGASVVRDGRRYKVVRGMASLSANVERKEVESGAQVDPADWERVVPEGVEAVVPYRGPVRDILHLMVGGLRSGLTYSGASSLAELRDKAEFVRITGAGIAESGHHDVTRLS
ncbi:MAG: IMP dehydrogenase [Vulcanimicrobiota bacterium]